MQMVLFHTHIGTHFSRSRVCNPNVEAQGYFNNHYKSLYIYTCIHLEMSAAPDTIGVILLGENHGADLGKAISESLDEFFKSPQNQQYNKIGCFREDFQTQVVELRLQLQGQPIKIKMPVP